MKVSYKYVIFSYNVSRVWENYRENKEITENE